MNSHKNLFLCILNSQSYCWLLLLQYYILMTVLGGRGGRAEHRQVARNAGCTACSMGVMGKVILDILSHPKSLSFTEQALKKLNIPVTLCQPPNGAGKMAGYTRYRSTPEGSPQQMTCSQRGCSPKLGMGVSNTAPAG